jgi:hypothetical protein
MQSTNSLKDLGCSLESLYNKDKQIVITLSDKPYTFHVVLSDRSDNADCKISSFGANLWARTNYGVKYKKYKTLKTLENALIKLIENKVDTQGKITFSLSDEIFTF